MLQLYHTPATTSGASPVSFDMAGHDDAEARRLCVAHLSAIIGNATIETERGVLSSMHGVRCGLADLSVMTCFFPPSPLRLKASGTPASGRVLMLRSMEGPLIVEQDGQAVEAELGDFLFVSGELPYCWHLPEGGRLDCGSLPAAAFRIADATLSRLMLRPIPRTFPPLQLLITYGAYLLMRGPHSAGEAEMANAHFNEILPLVVAYLETPSVPDPDRLLPVKRYIDDHLRDGDLDVSRVAGVLNVTPRYVQKLFQREGTTFSKYLLERRLDEARKLLLRNGPAHPIGATAYDVGFGDISYFNRTFRKRYGVAPSAVREDAQRTRVANG